MSDKVLEALRRLSKGQVTYIINTDDRSDHIGGNETFAKTGQPLAIGRAAQASVMIVAFNTILDRMSAPTGKTTAVPEKAWPNDPYSGPLKTLYFNGEGIEIDHQPGTTDGNSIVVFRHSDVISTGDIFDHHGIPDHRLEERREPASGDRGTESPEAYGDSGRPPGRGHDDRPRTWKDLRRGGSGSLPGNGHHRSRPPARHDQEGHDAGADQGGPADRRTSIRFTARVTATGRRICSSRRRTRVSPASRMLTQAG